MSFCHNKQYEREFVRLMQKAGVDSHHIAGSGSGEEAVCDVILFYNKKTYLVEVKATKEQKLYIRSHVKEQLHKMVQMCFKHNLIPILAVKFKHRGWNVHILQNYDNIEFKKEVVVNEHSSADIFLA